MKQGEVVTVRSLYDDLKDLVVAGRGDLPIAIWYEDPGDINVELATSWHIQSHSLLGKSKRPYDPYVFVLTPGRED
jgi:hypothetical protein